MDSLSGVGVLDKAIGVLAVLRIGPHNLAELQSATGLPRATAHRLAVALEAHGLVRRDDDGRFLLGFALLDLARAAAAGFPLAELARPILVALRAETAEGVQLYVREGDQRRCVVSLSAPHALQWIVPEGALLPLERGSAGRALLAGAPLEPDWFESVEERERGAASVSSPVRSSGGTVLAAVSVSGPLERVTRSPGALYGATVAAAAKALSAAAAEFAQRPRTQA